MPTDFKSAPHLIVSPMALWGVQSNWYNSFNKTRFVPVHRYPEGYDVEEYEVGMLARMRGDEIREVVRRVFCRGH